MPTTLLNSNFCFKTYASMIIGITKVKYTIVKEICKLSFDSNKSEWVFAFAFLFSTNCENVGCVLTCYVRKSMGWLHPYSNALYCLWKDKIFLFYGYYIKKDNQNKGCYVKPAFFNSSSSIFLLQPEKSYSIWSSYQQRELSMRLGYIDAITTQ